MKGAIFTGFAEFVEQEYGLPDWLRALSAAPLKSNGEFISTDLYDDSEFIILLTSVHQVTNEPIDQLQRKFGAFFFDTLYQLAKQQVANIDNLFEFLVAVDKVIHIEVQKADPLAYTPTLFYDQPEEDTLIIRYVSKRKMCHFAEGLILGAAQHFSQKIDISQIACMHEGAKHCLIKIKMQA